MDYLGDVWIRVPNTVLIKHQLDPQGWSWVKNHSFDSPIFADVQELAAAVEGIDLYAFHSSLK